MSELGITDKKIKKKRWPSIILIVLGVSLLLFFSHFFLLKKRPYTLAIDSEKLTIFTVKQDSFQEFISVEGTVLPITSIYLDAIEGGQVEEIYVEDGAFVKRGTPILRLSNTNLQLDIMDRETQFFEQQNNLQNTLLDRKYNQLKLKNDLVELNYQIKEAERLYHQNKLFFEKKIVPKNEFDQAQEKYEYLKEKYTLNTAAQKHDAASRKTQVDHLKASLLRMEKNLDFLREKLNLLTIKAPIDGQLTSLNAKIGELKKSGDRLGQIDVLNKLKIRANIDEHYITRIFVNQAGSLTIKDKNYELILKKVYPEVKEGRFEVDLAFLNHFPKDIRRGQTIRIRIALGDLAEAILLARDGFYQSTGGNWVYILNQKENIATKKSITLGRQNSRFFEVLEGLEAGDKVIVSSYEVFKDYEKLILK